MTYFAREKACYILQLKIRIFQGRPIKYDSNAKTGVRMTCRQGSPWYSHKSFSVGSFFNGGFLNVILSKEPRYIHVLSRSD